MIKLVGIICMAVCSGAYSYAQQAASASGGNGTGSGGTVSFTSVQASNSAYIGNSHVATEGVKSPYEIQVLALSEPAKEITLEWEPYASPSTDFLVLKINRKEIENMKYQLSDLNGKVLEEAFIGDVETSISLKPYKPTHYFLKVLDKSAEVTTFKITKIK